MIVDVAFFGEREAEEEGGKEEGTRRRRTTTTIFLFPNRRFRNEIYMHITIKESLATVGYSSRIRLYILNS